MTDYRGPGKYLVGPGGEPPDPNPAWFVVEWDVGSGDMHVFTVKEIAIFRNKSTMDIRMVFCSEEKAHKYAGIFARFK